MKRVAERVLVVPAVAVLVLAAACATPVGGDVRVIDSTQVPHGLLEPTTPPGGGAAGTAVVGAGPRAYFLDTDQLLVAVPLDLEGSAADGAAVGAPGGNGTGPSPTGAPGADVDDPDRDAVGAEQLPVLLQRLSAGPDEGERARGLGSALGPGIALSLDGVQAGTARIAVAELGENLAADRLPLAVGQIVLSVATAPGVRAVQLVRGGDVLEVPLPSGERTAAPLTTTDYAPLLRPVAAPPAPGTSGDGR